MPADGGRFVIRYDHRDTGRSVTSQSGRPGYTGTDLGADAAGVLDALGDDRQAHRTSPSDHRTLTATRPSSREFGMEGSRLRLVERCHP
jgi:hypothetical protein